MAIERPRKPADNQRQLPGHGRPVMAVPILPTHLFSHLPSSAGHDGRAATTSTEAGNRSGNGDEVKDAEEDWIASRTDKEPPQKSSLSARSLGTDTMGAPVMQKNVEFEFAEAFADTRLTESEGSQGHRRTSSPTYQITVYQTNDEVIKMIEDGIDYARECFRKGTRPLMARRVPLRRHHSIAATLELLENAAMDGLIHQVWASTDMECWEIPFEPAPQLGYPYGGIADPHWWVGKSAAEIKAGPMASEKRIRAVEAAERMREENRKKSRGSAAKSKVLSKLEEGLRRQKDGLKMYDSDDEEAMGKEWF